MRQLKGEKKRQVCKFKAIADMELPATLFSSCAGHGRGLPSLPAAAVWQQFGSSFTAVTPVPTVGLWKGITSTATGALGACCADRGEGSWVSQRCLQLLHRVWHLGQVMLIPHLKQHRQGHSTTTTQPWAPGQRTSRTRSTGVLCSILVTFSVPGEGGGRTPGGESMTQSVPRSQPCSGSKAMPKIFRFHIPFPKASHRCGQPRRAFPVAGTLVGATVMSQFRLKRNPIGTSLLKATS